MLTGVPPFPAAPLSETYRNIRACRYPEPAHLSPAARSLIARLLAPDPAERPSLDLLLQDSFFTQGFSPERLPRYCCHSPPLFARPPGLGGLLRKVQLLLPPCGPPCPRTSTDGSDPDSTEWGGEASPSDRGAPDPETPIRLLSQGTLGGDPAGPAGSLWVEVDAAIRTLQLFLDAGPRALQDPPGEPRPTLWAPQWVDYSSKYGFGYQLSDGGSAVLFRDGTHMALRPPAGQVCYLPSRGRLETFALRDVPSPLGAKLAVLRLLTHCLRRRRREEGALPAPAPPAGPGLCLLRFLSSQQALLLLLSDGTVQVSGSAAHTQVVLSGQGQGLLLTRWGRAGAGASASLDSLRRQGCPPAARQLLGLALRMLQTLRGPERSEGDVGGRGSRRDGSARTLLRFH